MITVRVFCMLLCTLIGKGAFFELDKEYSKTYYANGIVKAEGWLKNNKKEDYWFFYYKNGGIASKGAYKNNKKHGYWYHYDTFENLKEEGHFSQGLKIDWWIEHHLDTALKLKYINGVKQGFALVYQKNKLIKCIEFKDNIKIGEWTSVWAFKRDNPKVTF